MKLATFHTTSAAIQFDRKLKNDGIICTLKPIPRKLSSNCGICAQFNLNDYSKYINENLDKIYEILPKNSYKEIFSND